MAGEPVPEEALRSAAEALRPAIEGSGATFFEAFTAAAFLCFAEQGVRVAVVEVGLGGRLDATNVILPEVAAITNVGADHADLLGASLVGVAREKAGIFKPGVPALTAETDPALIAVLREEAERAGTRLRALEEVVLAGELCLRPDGVELAFDSRAWGQRELKVPLPGAHQARNALLAAEILATLPEGLRPEWEQVESGFGAVKWPGRLQREVLAETTWLFDVAHNRAGAEALAAALPHLELPRPLVLVAAVLVDKEWKAMLSTLLPHCDDAVLTTAPSAPRARRWDPREAAAALGRGWRVRVVPELGAALDLARTLASHGTVLVTGSVYTVGDSLRHLGIEVR